MPLWNKRLGVRMVKILLRRIDVPAQSLQPDRGHDGLVVARSRRKPIRLIVQGFVGAIVSNAKTSASLMLTGRFSSHLWVLGAAVLTSSPLPQGRPLRAAEQDSEWHTQAFFPKSNLSSFCALYLFWFSGEELF
jgi:hypothetical protein